jgi:hypothetical protein
VNPSKATGWQESKKEIEMASDMEILTRAYQWEYASKNKSPGGWQSDKVGASRTDIIRLKNNELIAICFHSTAGVNSFNNYRLTEKGLRIFKRYQENAEAAKVSAEVVLKEMKIIFGYDDAKLRIAQAIESGNRVHWLLEGPPAGGKTLFLEAIRNAIPQSYLAFGSRTSGAGLSEVLFESRPPFLLLDEVEKMDKDASLVLLGILESGELIETKSKQSRGVVLDTRVIGACNSSAKFKPEFLSRFRHLTFPEYTRDEFLTVAVKYLTTSEKAPDEIAQFLALQVYEKHLGDIRAVRSLWLLMNQSTIQEAEAVIEFTVKYSRDEKKKQQAKMI